MSELRIYKKPELQTISEETKIYQYPEKERNLIAKNIVVDFLSTIGIPFDRSPEINKRTIKHISQSLGIWTPKEIKKALELFILRRLDIPVFKQFNALVLSEVMLAYKAYKTENLKNYKAHENIKKNTPKEPTAAEIQKIMLSALKRVQDNYGRNGSITEPCVHVYDWLNERGKLNQELDYKIKVFKRAQLRAKSELSDKKLRKRAFSKALDLIDANKEPRVKVLAKTIVLEDYFKGQKAYNYET